MNGPDPSTAALAPPDQEMCATESPVWSRVDPDRSNGADELLMASWDAILDAEALLEGIRGSQGEITDFRYRDANRAMCSYLDMTREELIGRTALQTMPNLDSSGLLARYAQCADTHAPLTLDGFGYDTDAPARKGSGSRRYDIRANHVSGDLIIVSWRDATERTEAAAQARDRLMDSSAVGMCLITPAGRFEVVNQTLCDFLGHDAETLRQKTWQEVTAPDSLAEDLANVEEVLAGRLDRYRMTKQYIHADGHLIWGDLSVSCLRDSNSEVEYFVSQIIDITAQVETRRQAALREQHNQSLARRLEAQSDKLRAELTVASAYVKSVLPGDLDGRVPVSQRYLPSRELSGDCFDYRWLDDDHLMVYLIDVSGHGIAPALVSMSVHNLMRSGSQSTGTRKLRWLLEPAEVLAELNRKFPMDQHGGNYFTMWYGVYEASTRKLRYASAGHPPALLFAGQVADPVRLSSEGFPIGMFEGTEFRCGEYTVPLGADVLLYSDGAFELPNPQGGIWTLQDFVDLCSGLADSPDWNLDELMEELQARSAAGLFDDDCSLVLVHFR